MAARRARRRTSMVGGLLPRKEEKVYLVRRASASFFWALASSFWRLENRSNRGFRDS